MKLRRVLFVCSRARLRNPTAERVYADWPGVETACGGLNADADVPLTPEDVATADLIFVMEQTHRNKLSQRFRPQLRGKRVICLDIPDDYDDMDPALVALLEARVSKFL
jgi:predicted protein tyrosine phosphatase